MQLEEYALKLNAGDFACRSKAKAKPRRQESVNSPNGTILLVKVFGPMLSQENIQSVIMRCRRN